MTYYQERKGMGLQNKRSWSFGVSEGEDLGEKEVR